MKRTVVLTLLLSVSVPVLAVAQGGSNYSALGIGDLRYNVGALYDAMGGTSIAMPLDYGINVVNPAMLGLATTTRIQSGYRFNQHVITSNNGNSSQNNGMLDGLVAMFSVDTSVGFGVSFGILPYSTLNYLTVRHLQTELNGNTVDGNSSQQGKGGSSQLHLGASVRVADNLQIGVSFAALFGILEYQDQVVLNGNYFAVSSSQSYDIRGILYRGGLWWKPTPWLNLGAFASGGFDASVYITRHATGVSPAGTYYDTVQTQTSSSGLPVCVGVGASARVGRGFLGMDVSAGDYTGLTVNVRPDAQYTTEFRTTVGYTHPGDMTILSTFIDKIGYHFGAAFDKLYVTYNGNNLYQYIGAAGISFPLGGNAMVDAAIQGGWRGPAIENYLTEIFGRLTITVSIGETWFKPFGRD